MKSLETGEIYGTQNNTLASVLRKTSDCGIFFISAGRHRFDQYLLEHSAPAAEACIRQSESNRIVSLNRDRINPVSFRTEELVLSAV